MKSFMFNETIAEIRHHIVKANSREEAEKLWENRKLQYDSLHYQGIKLHSISDLTYEDEFAYEVDK